MTDEANETAYYLVPGMAEPFWAVHKDKAVNLDAETDMGDLTVEEFNEWFLPRAQRISQAQAWARNLTPNESLPAKVIGDSDE